MADDVERPFNLALAKKLVASSRHQLPPNMQAKAVDTIATLQSKLDKAVEGLEAIATSKNKSANGFRIWAKHRAQSTLKELQ